MRSCEVVVKTPGISRYRPEVHELEAAGIAVAGGLGLWMQEADRDRVACITGTKGKSTTTSIAGHLLQRWGFRCFIGGNIGNPPWDPQAEQDADFWVIETSSYQATDLHVAPRVVAVTSLHPDHLNWHGDLDTYYRDKLSICTLPGAEVTVSNAEDPVVSEHRSQLGEHVHWVPDADLPSGWVDAACLAGPAQHGQRAHRPSGAGRTRRRARPLTTMRSRPQPRASNRWPAGFKSSVSSLG